MVNRIIKILKTCMCALLFLISANLVFAGSAANSYEVSINISTINQSNTATRFVINNWEHLPHKDQRAYDDVWIGYVNNNYDPLLDWDTGGEDTSMKCLSYAASTVNDWFSIQTGKVLKSYTNLLNNRTENGTTPRELEQVYFENGGWFSSVKPHYDFAVIPDIVVTNEPVPYDIKGYADILTNPPNDWYAEDDLFLSAVPSSYNYSIGSEEYLTNWNYVAVGKNKEEIERALKKYGVLYGHVNNDIFGTNLFKIHSVPIIGYGEYNGTDYFWIHESYDSPYPQADQNTRYKAIEWKYINEILAFYDPQWPTFHHDNRRTGFTLLKGDIDSASDAKKNNLVLTGTEEDDFTRSSAADIDNDDNVDVVSIVAEAGSGDLKIFGTESYKKWWSGYIKTYQRWVFPSTGSFEGELHAPPSIGNIDSDSTKEVVFGLMNGSFYALNIGSSGKSVSEKWSAPYTVSEKYSAEWDGYLRGELSFSAIADVNNDGTNEIIFSDAQSSLPDWDGEVYVLDGSGNSASLLDKESLGDGGAFGAPSIADIDSDDKLEIIVPTYYGVRVFDFDSDTLSAKSAWNSNSDGKINGAIVVHDIDKDNDYEFIYTTVDDNCHASKTCYDRLYVRGSTGSNEGGSPVSLAGLSYVTPAVGDIDGDGDAEIIIVTRNNDYSYYGKVYCYEYSGSQCSGSWPFDNSGTLLTQDVSPDIADIDGDGDYEVVVVEKDSRNVYVISGSGTIKYAFDVYGEVGSAPAIADIDGDATAEIVVKRAGSPVAIVTAVGSQNDQPYFENRLNNMTAIVGEVIDINDSGLVNVGDLNGDSLSMSYSAPFNSSGMWQTGVNDTGNYSILVEVSDGNLTDYQEIDVIVFNSTVSRTDTFLDDSSVKSLNFTGVQNQTVYVRLPKNASVIYAQVDVEGGQT